MLREILISSLISCVLTACTFPSDLIGEWLSLNYGTLTFSTTSFSGFTSALHYAPLTFDCYQNTGQQYAVNSSYDRFVGETTEVYLCMNLQQISTIKFLYRLDSTLDTLTNVRSYTPTTTGSAVTLTEVCSYNDTKSPGEYDLLVLKANLTDALSSCPSEFSSLFNITDMSTFSSCNNDTLVASFDGQTNGLLSFNYSSCVSNIVFNSNGQLNCLHFFTEDYGYLTTYNNETVDNSKTFTFTCFVFSKTGATLFATEYPTVCQQYQTPTSVPSPGINYTMTDLLYVPPDDDNTLTIVLAVVFSIVGLIIIVIIILVLYYKVFRKKPEAPPAPKPRKKKKKISITEYSPSVTARSNAHEEKDGLKTHSEIVTQLLTDRSSIRYDHLDETKKEKWQEQWEKDTRQETSSTATKSAFSKADVSNLRGLNLMSFSADNVDQAQHLSMPLSLSDRRQARHRSDSNLPTSMHTSQGDPPSRLGVKTPLRAESFNISSNVLQKLRISPRLFQNTGKFQFETTTSNQDLATPKTIDSKLEAITENPLSRPSSTIAKEEMHISKSFKRSAEELNKLEKSLRERGSAISADRTTITTRSTASARGVFIDDWGTLSNVSEHKGSQINVFDDPGWLSKNDVNEADDVFKRGTSFWSSLPKGKDKDQKWFTSGTKKTDKTNPGDISYLNTRTTILTSGLNSMNKEGYVKSKKKRDWKFIWEKLKRPKHTTFSFFRRSRHRQIKPLRVFTTRSAGNSSDTDKLFLIDSLRKQNTKESLISNESERTTTPGIQTDTDQEILDLPAVNRPYSTVSEPVCIGRPGTSESLRARSEIMLDEVCDSLSIYSEIFLPENWLFENEEYLENYWKTGSRLQMTKVKNKVKLWLSNDANVFPLK